MSGTITDFLAEQELMLLEAGGVTNWDWYENALEDGECGDYADAADVINALDAAGVDNWTWYEESLRDFPEYRDYVCALPDFQDALPYHTWEKERDAEVARKAAADEAEATEKHAAKNVSVGHVNVVRDKGNSCLYDAVAAVVGEKRAEEVTSQLILDGFWKRMMFTKEFTKSLEMVTPGEGLVGARVEYVSLLQKNGKLAKKLQEYL